MLDADHRHARSFSPASATATNISLPDFHGNTCTNCGLLLMLVMLVAADQLPALYVR